MVVQNPPESEVGRRLSIHLQTQIPLTPQPLIGINEAEVDRNMGSVVVAAFLSFLLLFSFFVRLWILCETMIPW